MLKKALNQFFQEVNYKGWFLILFGTLTWSLTMVKSGLVYKIGMGFWGPNGHDGVWHIALAQSLANGSWSMPIFSGELIRNYHVGFDLILTIIHKITFIPITTLYFQILPPILAFLIGLFVYLFVLSWARSKTAAWWATFFVYFAGGWGWLVTLFRNGEISGESVFWSQQSVSTLVNPPFALSLVFIFAGLYFLIKGLKVRKSHTTNYMLLATFLFGILIQIKVYAGILVLFGLFAAGFWRMLKRGGIDLMKVFTGSLIISILIFSPFSRDIGQTINYQPFWFLETMVSSPDRFYWPKMASAIANYKLAGNWLKLFLAYGVTFAIFWFGNLGIRVIKVPLFFKHIRNIRELSYIEVFFYSVIGMGVVIPTLFVQKGTPWNTIQFFYYSLVFSGILAGVFLGEFIDKVNLNTREIPGSPIRIRTWYGTVIVVVLLAITTTFGTLRHYLPTRPPAMISIDELEALEFLSKQPNGVVLTQPFGKEAADTAAAHPPRPLYLYESTAYVSAFSGKPTYLEDEVNLEITGYDWRERRRLVEPFFGENCKIDKSFFSRENISYVYLVKQNFCNREFENFADKIFENLEVVIYKIT